MLEDEIKKLEDTFKRITKRAPTRSESNTMWLQLLRMKMGLDPIPQTLLGNNKWNRKSKK